MNAYILQIDGYDIKSSKMLVGRVKGAAGTPVTLLLRDRDTGTLKSACLVRQAETM